jgi:hypothetical protein
LKALLKLEVLPARMGQRVHHCPCAYARCNCWEANPTMEVHPLLRIVELRPHHRRQVVLCLHLMRSPNQLMIFRSNFIFRFFQICLAATRGIFINSYASMVILMQDGFKLLAFGQYISFNIHETNLNHEDSKTGSALSFGRTWFFESIFSAKRKENAKVPQKKSYNFLRRLFISYSLRL